MSVGPARWGLLVVLALATACGGSSSAQPLDGASTKAAATTAVSGPGFTLVTPADWITQDPTGDWELGTAPHQGGLGFLTILTGLGDPWLIVGSRDGPAGADVAGWLRQLRSTQTITYPEDQCSAPEDATTGSLGGKPAVVLAFHCPVDGPEALAVQVLGVHGGRGFLVMCYSEQGLVGAIPDAEEQCNAWLSGFEFA